jgi:peptide/nickel transport system substrate-binding protein
LRFEIPLVVALLAVTLFLDGLLAGCTPPPDPGTIRMGLATGSTNLDPRYATDATSARVNRLLYSRLVDFGPDGTPQPSLATWIQHSPTHYHFTLTSPIPSFHNGQPLSSHDIKATYDSILDLGSLSPHRGILGLIERIETPSEHEITFILNRPDPHFPGYLVIGILPANLIAGGHPFHNGPIGSGPFRFLERPDDSRLRLVRQSDGQKVEILRIPDPTVRALKLLAGEIQLIQNDLPPELVTYLAEHPDLRLHHHRGSNFAYLGFHHQDPLAGNLLVRQAIAHAINRPEIIHYVFGDRAREAQALFPPDHWAGPIEPHGYDYNPDRARTLLREAGFDAGHTPTLTYKTSTDPFRLRLATIIQDQLREVGIRVMIQSHDWGTFYGDIKAGRFQMYSLAWVGVKTPDIFRYAFHSKALPPLGANRGYFVSPVADRLIMQAEQTADRGEQQRLYRLLQEHFLRTLPYVPLWFEDHVGFTSTDITGYHLGIEGNFDGLLDVTWNYPQERIQPAVAADMKRMVSDLRVAMHRSIPTPIEPVE